MLQAKKEWIKWLNEITDNGGIAISVQADVSKEADVIRLFEETKKTFGTLDILVNNAVFQQYLPIEQATVEAFNQHFNVNVLGPTHTDLFLQNGH